MGKLNMTVNRQTRLCIVEGEPGYFHCWEQYADVVDASPLRGGHPGGQISQIFGIVEFKDGVRRVEPVRIKFCDEDHGCLSALAKHFDELKKGENNAEN